MKTLRYKSRGTEVFMLEELLEELGYNVYVSNYFGKDTEQAVKDFQQKNNLVVDGVVGVKTWSKLIEAEQKFIGFNHKFLAESDIVDFAKKYDLEVALVKAVNEIESNGKGFLVDGRPRILFEGHVFWRELDKRGITPDSLASSKTQDILYPRWSKTHYRGGAGEYTRLEKAAGLSDQPEVHDAAYCSASWGAYQIMGFHYDRLGYTSVDHFTSHMYEHEREHLAAFGKFLSSTTFRGKKLVAWLREQNWARFAEGYNGSGYKKNKYDQKLKAAYLRHSSQLR